MTCLVVGYRLNPRQPHSRLAVSVSSPILTSWVLTASISCVNSALSLVQLFIWNLHPCACLRYKQAGLLLLALRWPPCLSTGVLGSGPAFCCPPNQWHTSIKYMLDVLHWLPAEQRISYRIASLVWRCLVGLAPVYLRELCCPPLSAMSSRSLRSFQRGLLFVPFARTSTKQIRAFSVVSPSTWNDPPSHF